MGILTGIIIVLSVNLLFKTFGNDNGQKKLAEIRNVIDKNFSGEIDEEKLKDGMYAGYVNGLNDKYSYYMDKDYFAEFLTDSEGSYVGIGVTTTIDPKDGRIKIESIFEGSSVVQSGIVVGDKIISVEDMAVNYNNYTEAVKLLRGVPNTKVKITIFRESTSETFEAEVTRKNIDVPTINSELLEDNIGYIRIGEFDRVTYDQYTNALDNLKKRGAKRLIIDLRNNPGGLLDTVVKITDTLVPKGIITYVEDKYGEKTYEYSDDNCINMPLVILVNGNSASASEVLSGAVKDFGVGKLVGETTFGKGIVQNIFKLSDGSGIKVTIAKYYTPNGICIHGKGIKPDYEIKDEKTLSADFKSVNIPHSEDIQLQKGIEVVKELDNH